jgi:murein DD-endopeptidase MepM/ murein hydrolase activator NlpD
LKKFSFLLDFLWTFNMLRRILAILWVWALCGLLLFQSPALALDFPGSETPDPFQESLKLYDIIPDWSSFSFDDFGAIDTDGAIENLDLTWKSGDSLSSVLRLGDVSEALAIEQLSLSQISQIAGYDPSQLSLQSFPLITSQGINQLVEVVPNLRDFKLQDVSPLQALFLEKKFPESMLNDSLLSVLQNVPEFGELTLDDLSSSMIGKFSLTDIPNVEVIPIGSYRGWASTAIAQIPGLSQVPLSSMPIGLSAVEGVIARIDMIYGPAENRRRNTITGSYQVGFRARCPDDGLLRNPEDSPVKPAKCAYLELDDLENQGRSVQSEFEGKQWISGKYQEVEGGFGVLKYLPSPYGFTPGYEPTGRHPFGSLFKHVIWEPDEKSDQTTSYFFFRICREGLGCTPYNQFRVPFLTYPVNSMIFVGALDETASQIPNTGATSSAEPSQGQRNVTSPTKPGAAPCTGQSVGGLNLDEMAEAIASIESVGSGDYLARGVYTCDDAGICGRAIGKYQTMSYKESVQAAVSQKPGGAAWISSLNRGYQPTQQEVMTYYPPELQEQVYRQEMAQLIEQAQQEIDPKTGKPFTQARLIERSAQMWYAGAGSTIDSGGTDSLEQLSTYEYGVRARQHYESSAGQAVACTPAQKGNGTPGKASGTLSNPAPGSIKTSDYGVWRGDHAHSGIDLAGNQGDPVLAADGGTIGMVGWDGDGYGNFIVVDHGNGTLTLYAHLDSVSVQEGQSVAAGQTIGAQGNTGYSSGTHLHFEVIQDATPGDVYSGHTVDPEPYLKP